MTRTDQARQLQERHDAIRRLVDAYCDQTASESQFEYDLEQLIADVERSTLEAERERASEEFRNLAVFVRDIESMAQEFIDTRDVRSLRNMTGNVAGMLERAAAIRQEPE